jgi:protein-S-isoprenylcysteine O-methyltransferase Ste14
VFARASVKDSLSRLVPNRFIRAVYVWVASVLLILVCVLWRPIGAEIFRAPMPAAIALTFVRLVGVWFIAKAVGAIDALELAGIRQVEGPPKRGTLQVIGVYRLVRHPLYLGWMLAVFAAPNMTGDRLAFAAMSSAYLLVAIPWEERSLEHAFGEAYRRYKHQVRWRVVPFIY